VSSMG